MAPEVHTYHCLCSQLLLATTISLQSCVRRAGDSLDKAFILPISSSNAPISSASEDTQGEASSITGEPNYSVLVNTALDRKSITIRRSDGFESRYQHRCERCNLVIGYHLDNSQYGDLSQTGRREDVVYILPGALVTTTEMVEKKDSSSWRKLHNPTEHLLWLPQMFHSRRSAR